MTIQTRLKGRQLIAARLVWLVLAALVLGLAVATLPDFIREASTIAPPDQRTFIQLSPAEAQTLDQLGISVDLYVAFVLAWIMNPVVLYLLVASLIFWRRADDGVAFLMSLMLVAIGAAIPYLASITVFQPAWQTAVYFVRYGVLTGALALIYAVSVVVLQGCFRCSPASRNPSCQPSFPPWRLRRCSCRCAPGFKTLLTGVSIAVNTTPPKPWPTSAPRRAMRWT